MVGEMASSSTSPRQASTNLLKAAEVQFGMRDWWRAAMWDSEEGPERVEVKDWAYSQADL
jgi:hypothetical protein